METLDNIKVCVDCLQYIANGEFYYGQEDYDKELEEMEKVQQEFNALKQRVFLDCSEDAEDGFSIYPCGHCGSHLAGNRYKATLVQL
jgi:ribosomal protein L37AE/L43A